MRKATSRRMVSSGQPAARRFAMNCAGSRDSSCFQRALVAGAAETGFADGGGVRDSAGRAASSAGEEDADGDDRGPRHTATASNATLSRRLNWNKRFIAGVKARGPPAG